MKDAIDNNATPLCTEQLDKLKIYANRVIQWNSYVNLTGARNSHIFFTEHVADCLSISPFLEDKKSIIDVGSGCGLPGIILAILFPGTKIFTVEPLSKRHRFLNQLKIELKMRNLVPLNCRIQDLSVFDRVFHPSGRPALISRAFGDTKSFVDASSAFINHGCEVYLMKSEVTEGDLQFLAQFEYLRVHNIENSSFKSRVLVSFKNP